jgi:hypothetical protein
LVSLEIEGIKIEREDIKKPTEYNLKTTKGKASNEIGLEKAAKI